jgi:hypothetical protein
MIKEKTQTVKDIMETLKRIEIQTIAPDFKKGAISDEQMETIIENISTSIGTTKLNALVGTICLFLKGGASNGTPQNLEVVLSDGTILAKRNVLGAYFSTCGNQFLRRLAEKLAIEIGEFAEAHSLNGELAPRINTLLKAETGEVLTAKEAAWCSSFSQNIPDLAVRSSERVVRLLAEDYRKRFENKSKNKKKEQTKEKRITKKNKKK